MRRAPEAGASGASSYSRPARGEVNEEMADVELYREAWESLRDDDEAMALRLRIVDTVLFRSGRPYRWLFTSRGDGRVRRRKRDKLQWPNVVRCFLKMARGDQYAAVMRCESSRSGGLSSRAVTRAELASLPGPPANLVALQALPKRVLGNSSGVFSHSCRASTRDDVELALRAETESAVAAAADVRTTRHFELERWPPQKKKRPNSARQKREEEEVIDDEQSTTTRLLPRENVEKESRLLHAATRALLVHWSAVEGATVRSNLTAEYAFEKADGGPTLVNFTQIGACTEAPILQKKQEQQPAPEPERQQPEPERPEPIKTFSRRCYDHDAEDDDSVTTREEPQRAAPKKEKRSTLHYDDEDLDTVATEEPETALIQWASSRHDVAKAVQRRQQRALSREGRPPSASSSRKKRPPRPKKSEEEEQLPPNHLRPTSSSTLRRRVAFWPTSESSSGFSAKLREARTVAQLYALPTDETDLVAALGEYDDACAPAPAAAVVVVVSEAAPPPPPPYTGRTRRRPERPLLIEKEKLRGPPAPPREQQPEEATRQPRVRRRTRKAPKPPTRAQRSQQFAEAAIKASKAWPLLGSRRVTRLVDSDARRVAKNWESLLDDGALAWGEPVVHVRSEKFKHLDSSDPTAKVRDANRCLLAKQRRCQDDGDDRENEAPEFELADAYLAAKRRPGPKQTKEDDANFDYIDVGF